MSDPATLDSIRAALFAALQAISASPPTKAQPFASVGHFAGPATQETLAAAAANLNPPAALLVLESDVPVPEREVWTLVGGLVAQDSRSTWKVYIVVADAREDDQVHTVDPTMASLIKAVKGALSGLEIEGLGDLGEVCYRGTKEAKIERGVIYAYASTFFADYPSDVADAPVVGVPLEEIDIKIDLVDSTGLEPDNPIAQGKAILAFIQDNEMATVTLPIAQRPDPSTQPANTVFVASDAEYIAIAIVVPALGSAQVWWPITSPGFYRYGTASPAGTPTNRFAAVSGGVVTTATVAGQVVGAVSLAAAAGAPVQYGDRGVLNVMVGASSMNRGDKVMTDATGNAIPWTTGNFLAGVLLADAHPGDTAPVMLNT